MTQELMPLFERVSKRLDLVQKSPSGTGEVRIHVANRHVTGRITTLVDDRCDPEGLSMSGR